MMKNSLLRGIQFWLVTLIVGYALSAQADYKTAYENIEWNKRKNHDYYCIDIIDADFKTPLHPWLRALKCGIDLYNFSPKDYIEKMRDNKMRDGVLGAGEKFGWRVYSRVNSKPEDSGYGGDGYEGVVEVPKKCSDVGADGKKLTYSSTSTLLQWGCRNDNDDYYSIDILNEDGSMRQQSAACKDPNCKPGLHHFDPSTLNLPNGQYKWKVWSSPSGDYGKEGFEGDFIVGSMGEILYSKSCTDSGCHAKNVKEDSRNAKNLGANWQSIRVAINLNKGGMGKLKLSDEDLQKIAEYIKASQ